MIKPENESKIKVQKSKDEKDRWVVRMINGDNEWEFAGVIERGIVPGSGLYFWPAHHWAYRPAQMEAIAKEIEKLEVTE